MTREELIEKARRFKYPLNDTNWGQCVAEAMADFALSLQEPESKPWPQVRTVVWYRQGDGTLLKTSYADYLHADYLKQGRIHRTEAEAIRANEVEAANAAIKRWRDENAPFMADFTDGGQSKYYGIYHHQHSAWSWDCSFFREVPNGIPFASYYDLARCQSELPDAWAALVGGEMMSISYARWVATGDPRDGTEVYDDEGFEIGEPATCPECGSDELCPCVAEDYAIELAKDDIERCVCGHKQWEHPKFECSVDGCNCMGLNL